MNGYLLRRGARYETETPGGKRLTVEYNAVFKHYTVNVSDGHHLTEWRPKDIQSVRGRVRGICGAGTLIGLLQGGFTVTLWGANGNKLEMYHICGGYRIEGDGVDEHAPRFSDIKQYIAELMVE